jgi:hypothetical protein
MSLEEDLACGLHEWSIAVSEVGVQEAGRGPLMLTC